MNWWAVWRHVITAAFIAVMSAVQRVVVASATDSRCPDSYWDEPSKRCSRPVIGVLEHLRPREAPVNWSLTDPTSISRTCSAWQNANSCYQHLLSLCRSNDKAVQELQIHLKRYSMYALSCSGPSLRQQRRLFDCFLPQVGSTSSCTEAFDKYFRSYVLDKQYGNACRVVSSAMKCFHEVQGDIVSNPLCSAEVRSVYQSLYIQPLIDLTRDVVTAHCDISPTYEQYLTSTAATPSERFRTMCAVAASVVLALSFVRWRDWSR